ncbi:hypothetical protein CFO_g2190 [Ceratocystis platani]|uniref:DNA/RNA-binding protein Alba-like domain-containing protein n=1 Tax=Ceratocystis fimbriata f. sp. platani TaxID=88771 RepID=A0A0F8B4X4_CERFI|nr:hypothetical protein CFO_g2190 [Ceratocystis platani]
MAYASASNKRKHVSSASPSAKKPRLQPDAEENSAGAQVTEDKSSAVPAPQQPTALTNGPSTPLPMTAHEPLLSTLSAKYSVLALSVISSSQLRTRITRALNHLSAANNGNVAGQPALVFLHARPGDVGKMISIAEKVKCLMAAEGKPWVQYNRLFESASKPKGKKLSKHAGLIKSNGGAEKIVAVSVGSDAQAAQEPDAQDIHDNSNDEDDEDDYFESTARRFDKAANPPEPTRLTMSLSIFLSTTPIPELRNIRHVSIQSSKDTVE